MENTPVIVCLYLYYHRLQKPIPILICYSTNDTFSMSSSIYYISVSQPFSLRGTLLTNKNVCGTQFDKRKSSRNPISKFLTIILIHYPHRLSYNSKIYDWNHCSACKQVKL